MCNRNLQIQGRVTKSHSGNYCYGVYFPAYSRSGHRTLAAPRRLVIESLRARAQNGSSNRKHDACEVGLNGSWANESVKENNELLPKMREGKSIQRFYARVAVRLSLCTKRNIHTPPQSLSEDSQEPQDCT